MTIPTYEENFSFHFAKKNEKFFFHFYDCPISWNIKGYRLNLSTSFFISLNLSVNFCILFHGRLKLHSHTKTHTYTMAFTDFSKIDTVKELNTVLGEKSYVEGYGG